MNTKRFVNFLLIALILRLVFAFFPEQIHTDLRNSIDWGTRFWDYGANYLYNFWWVPQINSLMHFLTFSDRVIPRVLGMVSTISFAYLYRDFARHFRSYLKR